MKKTLLLIPIVAMLAACGSTDPYQKRADIQREQEEAAAKQQMKNVPAWAKDKPEVSTSAILAAGEGVSKNREHSEFLARNFAYAKICMSNGGTVDKRGRVFQTENNTVSEQVIVSACSKTDVTGVETKRMEQYVVGNRFQTFVMVALPLGDANILKKTKNQLELEKLSVQRAQDEFKKLEN
jgi:hypothetical protein